MKKRGRPPGTFTAVNTKRITLAMPPELFTRIQMAARKDNRTAAAYIRHILDITVKPCD